MNFSFKHQDLQSWKYFCKLIKEDIDIAVFYCRFNASSLQMVFSCQTNKKENFPRSRRCTEILNSRLLKARGSLVFAFYTRSCGRQRNSTLCIYYESTMTSLYVWKDSKQNCPTGPQRGWYGVHITVCIATLFTLTKPGSCLLPTSSSVSFHKILAGFCAIHTLTSKFQFGSTSCTATTRA